MTYEEYTNHTCTLGEEDGCKACEAWWTEARYKNVALNLEVELKDKIHNEYV